MPTIKFTDITGQVPEQFNPIPAKLAIPEWLKRLAPYLPADENDTRPRFRVLGNRETNQTAKRCLPMLDAVMAGYILPLSHDVDVTRTVGMPSFQWFTGLGVGFHSPEQLSTHEAGKGEYGIPKILNPWAIETPAGYSCLFIPQLNSDKTVVSPFAGVVDTDQYYSPVNFPFQLAESFTGIIPAGTPIVQVIPFKRETWKMEIESGTNQRIARNQNSIFTTFRNAYRNMYWNRKDYS